MSTLGLIFSSTHSKEDFEITKTRSIASVPVGGRYRLVDFALSNMVNDNISHVGIVTKSNYQSLMDHVGSGKEWDLARKNSGLTILPPFGTSVDMFATRLEALKSIISFIKRAPEEYVILTDCYYVCNMDFEPIFRQHFATNADITCVYRRHNVVDGDYTPVKVLTVNENKRIVTMKTCDEFRGNANVSLDIWIMKKDLLEKLVLNAIDNNLSSFNVDILQKNLDNYKICGYEFSGYVKEVGSLKTYFDLNMDLLNKDIRDELFNQPNRSIYTKVRDSAPTKYMNNAKVKHSLIGDGCTIDGIVQNSIIFRGVTISQGCVVKNSIIMQGCSISENAKIDYSIIDKNVHISKNKNIVGTYENLIYIKKNEVI